MNAKKIFVDAASFQGNDKQNPIGCVLQQIAQVLGETCTNAEDAGIVIVGTSQGAMMALSASDTNQVVLVAVKEGWKNELIVGTNLRGNFPRRFSMYSLLPVPEMEVDAVEELFGWLRQ